MQVVSFKEQHELLLANNFGTITKPDGSGQALREKYANYTKYELKRELKTLQRQCPVDLESIIIQYVSKLLRNKATRKFPYYQHSVDHDKEIKKNFWSYIKEHLDAEENPCPTFNSKVCTDYLKRIWKPVCPIDMP